MSIGFDGNNYLVNLEFIRYELPPGFARMQSSHSHPYRFLHLKPLLFRRHCKSVDHVPGRQVFRGSDELSRCRFPWHRVFLCRGKNVPP